MSVSTEPELRRGFAGMQISASEEQAGSPRSHWVSPRSWTSAGWPAQSSQPVSAAHCQREASQTCPTDQALGAFTTLSDFPVRPHFTKGETEKGPWWPKSYLLATVPHGSSVIDVRDSECGR